MSDSFAPMPPSFSSLVCVDIMKSFFIFHDSVFMNSNKIFLKRGRDLQGYMSKLSASTTVVHKYLILDSVLEVLMFHMYGMQTDNQTPNCLNHSIMSEVVLSKELH